MLKTLIRPVCRTKEEQLLNKYGGRSILDNKTKVTETNKHKLNLNKPTTIKGKDGTSQSRSNSRSVSATKSRPIYQKIFNDNKNYGYLRDSRNNKNFHSNRQSSYRQNKPVSKENININQHQKENVNINSLPKQKSTSSLSEFSNDHEFIEFLK